MISRLIKRLIENRERKLKYDDQLNKLQSVYNKAQEHVDHEGKMRAYCEWDDIDYANFKKLVDNRDAARLELANWIKN